MARYTIPGYSGQTRETARAHAKLFLRAGGYVVDFAGTEREHEIKDLFGSTVIPTAYTSMHSRDVVLAELRRLGTVVE